MSETATGAPVLQAEGLVRRFGAVTALDCLSLTVEAGELFGLVGPDGAGKTTAMRIFAGMIGSDEGRVRVLDQAPTSRDQALRRAIGYMPQQYSLYGDLSVDENLRFFARMFCLSRADFRARRERLLALTRLERFATRRAEQLSGGMYKKLALACALLPEPRLLLLDEPTNGVDPVSRRELWALLFELTAQGIAVLVTTPYMDEAARCHRVALIDQGRTLLLGRPEALLAAFAEPVYELDAADDVAGLEGWVAALPQVCAVSVAGGRLRVVLSTADDAAVLKAFRARGLSARRVAPDFEDLFLAQTASSGSKPPSDRL
ncbi:MAG: ABC transporter ATP-binding protein [Proteobacteria bacterium]|nr:ABC transporter ATP-binding protein [Pseudomonadota bacterium]